MSETDDDIHRRSADSARHEEHAPHVHPAIERAQHERVGVRLNPWPKQFNQTPYGEQNENGTDVSLVRGQMRLSPTERVDHADRTTADNLWLMRNVRRDA